MKLTRTQTIAAAVAGAVVVVAGGAAIHAASVREQNCLSYERQSLAGLTKMNGLMTKAEGMMAMVNENPFAAFGLIGELMPLKSDLEATQKSLNDTKYAYVKSCGEARFNKFVDSPAVKSQVDSASSRAANLSN